MATNYAYALTYVNFDIDNKDVIYFKNKAEKESYFNLSSLFSGELKYINFEKKNLLETRFIVDSSNDNIIKNEFSKNYLIIKEISTSSYYFYFIISTKYDNKAHLELYCKLDTFTTFRDLLNPRGVIKRATFELFTISGTYTTYDRDSYTHILTIDDSYKGEKFLQAQKTIYPHIYTYTSHILDEWIEANVEAWQYIFVDKNHTYKHSFDGSSQSYMKAPSFTSKGVYNDYSVLAFPIYKSDKSIILRYRDNTDIDNPILYDLETNKLALKYFRDENNDSTYIYTMKLSKQPPFNAINSVLSSKNFNCSISLDNGNLIMDFGSSANPILTEKPQFNIYGEPFYTALRKQDSHTWYGEFLISINEQTYEKYNNDLSSFIQNYFSTKMLISTYRNVSKPIYKYPNVMCNKNVEVRITYNGEIFSIHPSRLDTSKAILEMQEAIAPDITKIYVGWQPNSTYIDSSAMSKTLTGYIFNDDTSIPVGNSYMAEFLANNKNFYLQRYINTAINSGTKGAKAYATGGVGGLALSVINSGLDVANMLWEEDNLEQRKSSLRMANGSALFNNLVKEYGCKCEIWMFTKEELNNIAEYYNKYGVASNTNGTLNDMLEKHIYFDYVEMDVTDIIITDNNITGITQEIKQDIINKLKRGVRFWYDRLYDYTFFNYEKAIE